MNREERAQVGRWLDTASRLAVIVERNGGGAMDDYERMKTEAYKLISDLDRCEHGRHAIDSCFGCPGGHSAGNPHLRPGQIVGYDYTGRPYRVPTEELWNRQMWLSLPSNEGDNHD